MPSSDDLRAAAIHDTTLPEVLRRVLLDELEPDDLWHMVLPDWLGVDEIVARILELPADIAATQAQAAEPEVQAKLLQVDRRPAVQDDIVAVAGMRCDRYPDAVVDAAVASAASRGRDVPDTLWQRLSADRQAELALQYPAVACRAGEEVADLLLRRDPTGRQLVAWLDERDAAGHGDSAAVQADLMCFRLTAADDATLQIDDDSVERLAAVCARSLDDVRTATAAARRLKTVPGRTFDERVQLLGAAPRMDEAWLTGHTVNDPRPGEVSRWLQGDRNRRTPRLVACVRRREQLPGWVADSPWVDEIVAGLPVGAKLPLELLERRVATKVVAAVIGTDLQAWHTVFTLIDSADEQLTYRQVAAMAAAVSER